MELKKEGIILALKNIGVFLGSYTIAGIETDISQFLLAFLVYVLISVPSDLYLMNHATKEKKQK